MRFRPAYSAASATFSVAESVGIRLKPWKMKPISSLRRRVSARPRRVSARRPLIQTSPASGVSRQPIMCIIVDLPEPDGPMIATISPGRMCRLAPRSASTKLSLPSW